MRPRPERGTAQYQDSKSGHLYEVQNHEDRFFIIWRVSLNSTLHFSRIGFSEAGFGFLCIYPTRIKKERMRWHCDRRCEIMRGVGESPTAFFQLCFEWKGRWLAFEHLIWVKFKKVESKKIVDTRLVSRARRSEGFFTNALSLYFSFAASRSCEIDRSFHFISFLVTLMASQPRWRNCTPIFRQNAIILIGCFETFLDVFRQFPSFVAQRLSPEFGVGSTAWGLPHPRMEMPKPKLNWERCSIFSPYWNEWVLFV